VVILLLSFGIYTAYFFISNYLPDTYSEQTPIYLIQTGNFFLMIILLNAVIFIFDLSMSTIVRELFQTEVDKMLQFKRQLRNFIRKGCQDPEKKSNLVIEIAKMQQEKREAGLEREWGDSFFEELLEANVGK
jgi:phospholipid-transporting ATPase